MLMTLNEPEEYLYNGMNPMEQLKWSKLLVPQAVAAHLSPVKNEGWMHVPCAFSVGRNDKLAIESVQEATVAMAIEKGARMRVFRGNGGHSPYLTHPAQLLDLVSQLEAEIAS